MTYINDLEEGIESHVMFFFDDTSLFSIVKDRVGVGGEGRARFSFYSLFHTIHIISLLLKWAQACLNSKRSGFMRIFKIEENGNKDLYCLEACLRLFF